jgi:hypothetical protein
MYDVTCPFVIHPLNSFKILLILILKGKCAYICPKFYQNNTSFTKEHLIYVKK